MRGIIITGGNIDRLFFKNEIEKYEYDQLIAVDGGAKALIDINLLPDVLIGDLDTIDSEQVKFCEESGVKVIPFPPEKDMTDTDIAIEYGIKQGMTDIIIFGGFGTRMDHSLGNIFLLEKYINKAKIRIINKQNIVGFLEAEKEYHFMASSYKYLSLLPITDLVEGIITSGFKYDLHNKNLIRKNTMGISNELNEEKGTIKYRKGLLLVILSKD